jgi:hypothetical protein
MILLQEFSRDPLAFAFVVNILNIRSIKKIDSTIYCLAHDRKGFFLICRPAEVHRSQTKRRDEHSRATQFSVFHNFFSFVMNARLCPEGGVATFFLKTLLSYSNLRDVLYEFSHARS